MTDQRTILVLPSGPLYQEIMSPRAEAKLRSLGEIVQLTSGQRNVSQEEILGLLPRADAVLTSWGAPKFDARLLEHAPRLKIIGHAAGSIKGFILPEVFDRGIAVTHAASTIADSVGEWVLTVTLIALRRAYDFNRTMHEGGWAKREFGFGEELYRKRVGIVAASMTGRVFIRLLKPFDCDVVVYDPYLSPERAHELGVRLAGSLDELFETCDVVSNHAPTTPETTGMIGAAQLAKLRDNALFVNTARAAAIDYDALTRELQSGRIRAALDVFPKEPLVADSPLRGLPNVILSPHVAGGTVESRRRLGETIVDELARFFAGEPLKYGVTKQMLMTMA
ncbi:MAG: hydroxyacid dehydrogenase [Chloroflexi bacterium]|nr:hydroxyacid dehydrogenase [Chloroflexota bacterium]